MALEDFITTVKSQPRSTLAPATYWTYHGLVDPMTYAANAKGLDTAYVYDFPQANMYDYPDESDNPVTHLIQKIADAYGISVDIVDHCLDTYDNSGRDSMIAYLEGLTGV